MSTKAINSIKPCILILFCLLFLFTEAGCKSAPKHRLDADASAGMIIKDKQAQLLGTAGEFNIERPSDILRRRLLIEQGLPFSGDSSLGTDKLELISHWPEKDYPRALSSSKGLVSIEPGKPLRLSLVQALQVGALNSADYQTKKEDVFRSALNLDLKRNDFGFTLRGQGESSVSIDKSGSGSRSGAGDTVKGLDHSGSLNLSRTFQTGAKFAAALAVDLVSLLTQGRTSSLGIVGDASISIPLLRGSGRHIVAEPLTQAERNVMYAIYEFERYKKRFAVDIARNYLEVLKQLDRVDNAAENYRNLMESARRSRRLADAGRVTEIVVDQGVQNELTARIRWIAAMESYKGRLDLFKKLIGLPPDSDIALERSELSGLTAHTAESATSTASDKGLIPPGRENAGPFELDEVAAIGLGLDSRLDLRVLNGKVYDAQRSVVVQADALGAELTFLGEAESGQHRSISTAGLDDASLRADRGVYTGLLKLDLPFERTAERNAYRNSFILLERAVREFQKLEDDIKLSIRQGLRDMSEAREGLRIQTRAVTLAEKRVKSTDLFFEAGRAQIRDLLEAQESLLNARNALTGALVDYRVAELGFQRDAGLLSIDKDGLIIEHIPGGKE
ncbi:TolC family protein [Thermodesulfobacteriota bacterium]